MIRKALIIYCDDTSSGKLNGPVEDNKNIIKFLTNNLGGEWNASEILPLRNPTILLVKSKIATFLKGADYTFIVFSGHGYINVLDKNLQYLELSNGDISIRELLTDSRRQTIVIDSCRGLLSVPLVDIQKSLNESIKMFSVTPSTRELFNTEVMAAEEGLSILYAASVNESAGDSDEGGCYLLSLLGATKIWADDENTSNVLGLKDAHKLAIKYMKENMLTIQKPKIMEEKRNKYFPFAVRIKADML